jgi:hypothetical protein
MMNWGVLFDQKRPPNLTARTPEVPTKRRNATIVTGPARDPIGQDVVSPNAASPSATNCTERSVRSSIRNNMFLIESANPIAVHA